MQPPTMKIQRYVGHSLSPWDLRPRALIMFDLSLHWGPLASSASREQTDTKDSQPGLSSAPNSIYKNASVTSLSENAPDNTLEASHVQIA